MLLYFIIIAIAMLQYNILLYINVTVFTITTHDKRDVYCFRDQNPARGFAKSRPLTFTATFSLLHKEMKTLVRGLVVRLFLPIFTISWTKLQIARGLLH